MKMTVTIIIGNSDNKLTQTEWKDYCNRIHDMVRFFSTEIHFSAPSVGWADWQNAAWIFEVDSARVRSIKDNIREIRRQYRQDSVAWVGGTTKFI